jgi:hypothetical protein
MESMECIMEGLETSVALNSKTDLKHHSSDDWLEMYNSLVWPFLPRSSILAESAPPHQQQTK